MADRGQPPTAPARGAGDTGRGSAGKEEEGTWLGRGLAVQLQGGGQADRALSRGKVVPPQL